MAEFSSTIQKRLKKSVRTVRDFLLEPKHKIEEFDAETVKTRGQGFRFKGSEFVHHSALAHEHTAFQTVVPKQKLWIAGLVAFLVLAFAFSWRTTLFSLIVVLTILYFVDLLFNLLLIYRSFARKPELNFSAYQLTALDERTLPTYTIFCPLYREWAVLPQFTEAISKLDYPKDRLQVLLLLEEDDKETIERARAAGLPSYYEIIVVPHSFPKTKPKAMNYGLNFAKGEYITIYDAEDVPEPEQLKKAVLAFEKLGPRVICVQGKLNFYNPDQNFLTKLFTAEYSLWFDLVLPGLQSLNAPIPLGGTSNHFRAADLKKLKGWDAFNVTEDCDLGMRLVKNGYRTAIIDSTTYEEANSDVKNWYRQRSRWIKGYMQTYLVHMRQPKELWTDLREPNLVFFQMIVGGKILSMFVNPLLWAVTAIYFIFRSHVAAYIEPFFPSWVLYFGVFSLVFGNFLYLYYYMIGLAKRGHDGLIKYVFIVPFYWLGMSVAAWQALYEVIVKPHYWAKTVHGLHLNKDQAMEQKRVTDVMSGVPLAAPVPKRTMPGRVPFVAAPSPAQAAARPPLPSPIASAAVPVRPGAFAGGSIISRRIAERAAAAASAGAAAPAAPEIALQNDATPPEQTKPHWLIELLKNKVFVGSTMYVGAIMLANFLNFLFNALLGRVLQLADFGTVALFNTILSLAGILFGSLTNAVNHRTAFLSGERKLRAAAVFSNAAVYVWLPFMLALGIVWLVLVPQTAAFFHIKDPSLVLFFVPVIPLGAIAAIQSGYLKGRFKFGVLGFALVIEAFSKLAFAWGFIMAKRPDLVSLAIPLSIVVSFLLTFAFTRTVERLDMGVTDKAGPRPSDSAFPKAFFTASLLGGLSVAAFLNVDVLLAKHFLDPVQAGAYSLLSLIGKMVYLFGSLLSVFVTSIVGRHDGAKTDPRRDFYRLFNGTLFFTAVVFLITGVFGKFTATLLFGANAIPIAPYLLMYCGSMALFTITSVVVGYHVAKRNYAFSAIAFISALCIILGISLAPKTIASFTEVMFLASIVNVVTVFGWHALRKNSRFILRNLTDLFDILMPLPTTGSVIKGTRILVFNWRDTKHAFSGGAETYIHELSRRWVAEGNMVTLFCGNDGNSSRNETVDGVQVIRRGGFYFVYVWAFLYYLAKFRGRYDIIIDCQNGIPFFTPLYAKEPVYCLLHHVHQEVFHKYLNMPLASLASFLEGTMMPMVYKQTKFITVSHSSKKDMEDLGLGTAGTEVIFPGVDLDVLRPGVKSPHPTILYLGRLKAYKSVDVLVNAFVKILRSLPNAELVIAGDGEQARELHNLVEELHIEDNVTFRGKVSDADKVSLFQRAWVFVNPSMMEGWGITTIEANACGVPVVASNVPGLRDSVDNPHTGYLVPHGDIDQFSEKILHLLQSSERRESMSIGAIKWASKFKWDQSSRTFLSLIDGVVESNQLYHGKAD